MGMTASSSPTTSASEARVDAQASRGLFDARAVHAQHEQKQQQQSSHPANPQGEPNSPIWFDINVSSGDVRSYIHEAWRDANGPDLLDLAETDVDKLCEISARLADRGVFLSPSEQWLPEGVLVHV